MLLKISCGLILIISPKNKNSILQIVEEDEDLINLVDGESYFIVWQEGMFQVNEIPKTETDGSIILPTDSLIRVSRKLETNINIDFGNEKKWNEFWQTHTISHYIIRDGFDVDED